MDALLPTSFHSTLFTIEAGSGGIESRDWCAILTRMYIKWAKKRNLIHELIDWTGDKYPRSVTLSIQAPLVLLANEEGVHRLTRSSPFGTGKVHTSFAKVYVIELIPAKQFGGIKEKDLKIEYFRSGGNGGQNAQKNSTAVRIKHIPTNITATCQSERSQLQNYKQALDVLTSRVAKLLQQKQETAGVTNCWGEAFRSYVLNGKLRIKDKRSGFETSSVQIILDGELNRLLSYRC